jgi:Fe-S-cluster-containing dehydrogenase component
LRYISFDQDRCVGCQICPLVCSGTWEKVFNPLKANLRIESTGWYGHFKAYICRQRNDADCVKACPTGALYPDDGKGIVRLDRNKCDGCKLCIDACPNDAIFEHPDCEYIFKCNLCGGGEVQRCVESCPRGALSVKEVFA